VECVAHQPLLQTFPTLSSLVGVAKPAISGRLVYLLFTWMPAPPSLELKAPRLLCYVSFSILCLLFSFFLCVWGGGQTAQRAMLVDPRGGCGDTICRLFAHLLSVSPKQVRSQHLVAQEPSCFLRVMWHGEAMCRLGVWSVRVLPLLGGFSCQVYLQHLSKIFPLWSSSYLLPPFSRHLGT
jgi:hypothetical protein